MKKISMIILLIASSALMAKERIRTEVYDPDQVFTIHGQIGRATLIQVEPDESLTVSPASVLGMGDADAWTLSARGNNIIFKPSKASPATNMIVVTNKRTYAFDLRMAQRSQEPTYILKFRYPDTEMALALKAAQETERKRKIEPRQINTAYSWRGDNELLVPTAAWDDGRFTRLEYDHAGELPVFYKVLPDGTESLMDKSIDANDRKTVVLHEVIRTVRARLGQDVIEIVNTEYVRPKLNNDGASEPGVYRVEREQ